MGLLEELMADFQAITPDQWVEPKDEITDADNEVGTMTDELKSLYALRFRCIDEGEVIPRELSSVAEAKFGKSLDNLSVNEMSEIITDEVRKRMKRSIIKIKLADDIFWRILEYEFPELHRKESVGVRQGYKVVWSGLDLDSLDILDIAEILSSFLNPLNRLPIPSLN